MKLNYFLDGFGFRSSTDFKNSLYGYIIKLDVLAFASLLGLLRGVFEDVIGLDSVVIFAFVFLIFAETWTGIKVARRVKGERFKSRKFGRMFLKVGVYVTIIAMLNALSKIDIPDLFGLTLNPFRWLYYMIFIGIVLQLLISYFENLGALGYKEAKGLTGFILRKFNKWFEFDGTKNNDQYEDDNFNT